MKTQTIFALIISILLLVVISGCDTISNLLAEETPEAATPTPLPTQTPTPGVLGVDTPISLQLWVPPEFDPQGDDPAAELLRERLDEYSQMHPGIRVVTRVKATEGPAGMIESLSTAVLAAPLALPDLLLLSSRDTHIAADRNLIYPLQAEIEISESNDWYGFAADLVTGGDQTWGIPFAVDVMVMAYRPALTPEAPASWEGFLEQGQRMVFPAADPQALFTLLLYLSESGQTLEDYENFGWDDPALVRVLYFVDQAQASNLMPYWLTQLESDQATWESFVGGQAEFGITWMRRYLQEGTEYISIARIPTQGKDAFSLASGWVWAVATPDVERQAAAESLAAFLTEAGFGGSWSEAAGLLPVRPGGLANWEIGDNRALAEDILPHVVVIPNDTIMSIIGPPLQQATMAILKQELTASEAAAEALSQLENPQP